MWRGFFVRSDSARPARIGRRIEEPNPLPRVVQRLNRFILAKMRVITIINRNYHLLKF